MSVDIRPVKEVCGRCRNAIGAGWLWEEKTDKAWATHGIACPALEAYWKQNWDDDEAKKQGFNVGKNGYLPSQCPKFFEHVVGAARHAR